MELQERAHEGNDDTIAAKYHQCTSKHPREITRPTASIIRRSTPPRLPSPFGQKA